MEKLTHFGEDGRIRMVDISEKEVTRRMARAQGFVRLSPRVLSMIREGKVSKGNPLEVARVAGIMAAKNTSQLIPLCHPLSLSFIDIQFELTAEGIRIESMAVTEGKTGVEMEALTGVTLAALTIHDMCKSADRQITITEIHLMEKSGGRSGHFVRSGESPRS